MSFETQRPLCLQCLSRVCAHFDDQVHLTPRECSVVKLVMRGLSNKEIAEHSVPRITEGTVKVYKGRIFEKLGLTSSLELALWGRKNREALG